MDRSVACTRGFQAPRELAFGVAAPYTKSVFINCPLDDDYRPILEAIVFGIHDCGFTARSALEVIDAGEVRIDKIRRIIRESKFGIHDISRTQPDRATQLPRFNMPLELVHRTVSALCY